MKKIIIENLFAVVVLAIVVLIIYANLYLRLKEVFLIKHTETLANQNVQELKDNISRNFGISENVTVYVIENCSMVEALLVGNRIQICANSNLPLELLLKHELGHLKDPVWWRYFTAFLVFATLSITLYVFMKTRGFIILMAHAVFLLPIQQYGSEFFAYYYSDIGMFNTVISLTLLTFGLWVFTVAFFLKIYPFLKVYPKKVSDLLEKPRG